MTAIIDLRKIKPTTTAQPQATGLTRCRLPLARNRRTMAERYPNLLRAMCGVAILSPNEAEGALESLIVYGYDGGGEAVNHYGGAIKCIQYAYRFRANYYPNPADDLTNPTSEISIAWLISETFTAAMATAEPNPKKSRWTRLEAAYDTAAAQVCQKLGINRGVGTAPAVSVVEDIIQRWVTELTPSFPAIMQEHRNAAKEIQTWLLPVA